MGILSNKLLSDKIIVSFCLILMSVHYVLLEGGYKTSNLKTAVQILSFFLILLKTPHISKAILLSSVYFIITVFIYYIQYQGNELTFVHIAIELSLFCFVYNMVYINNIYSVDDFLNLIRTVIWLYFIVLILQQVAFLAGLRGLNLINLMGQHWYRLFRLPSMTLEPSHTARILTVYVYAFLKLKEIQTGHVNTLRDLFQMEGKTIFASLYVLLAIGSGTAIVGLGLLSLFFLKRQYVVAVFFVLIIMMIVIPYIDYEPLNRTMLVLDATISGDVDEVVEADRSASDRVSVIMYTFSRLNIWDVHTWLGYGPHNNAAAGIVEGIGMYGLVSYILKLFLLFSCCFSGVIDVLFFIILLSLDIRNFSYAYCMIMVLSVVKYFVDNVKR